MSDKKITIEDLNHIAKLARIKLTKQEKETFLPQLESVIGYFDLLNKVDTTGIVPTYRVNDQKNILREDKVGKSLSVKESLSQAKRTKDNYFLVTATIKK